MLSFPVAGDVSVTPTGIVGEEADNPHLIPEIPRLVTSPVASTTRTTT